MVSLPHENDVIDHLPLTQSATEHMDSSQLVVGSTLRLGSVMPLAMTLNKPKKYVLVRACVCVAA